MKTVLLNGGEPYRVQIHHTSKEVSVETLKGYTPPPGQSKVLVRATDVRLVAGDGWKCEVTAYCSPLDNFCRLTGRRVAAEKLIGVLNDLDWAKEDRREVFRTICPEYA